MRPTRVPPLLTFAFVAAVALALLSASAASVAAAPASAPGRAASRRGGRSGRGARAPRRSSGFVVPPVVFGGGIKGIGGVAGIPRNLPLDALPAAASPPFRAATNNRDGGIDRSRRRRRHRSFRVTASHSFASAATAAASEPSGEAPIPLERARLLSSVLAESGLADGFDATASDADVVSLSNGFCNWVYRVGLPPSSTDGDGDGDSAGTEGGANRDHAPRGEAARRRRRDVVVVKIFSPLAKVRVDESTLGSGYQIASSAGLGPTLLYRGRDGLVMECVKGDVLTVDDVHGVDGRGRFGTGRELCEAVGRKLAGLHNTPIPREMVGMGGGNEGNNNALWKSLGAMLDFVESRELGTGGCGSGGDFEFGGGRWSTGSLRDEISMMREALDALDLGVVLGHNDFKPANVMVPPWTGRDSLPFQTSDIGAVLIDFELAGPNHRGFDLCKFFRSSKPTEHTRGNAEAFARAYLEECGGCEGRGSEAAVESLLAEAKLFEPLTWLEAGVFFLFAAKGDLAGRQRWEGLAFDRLENYSRCVDRFRDDMQLFLRTKPLVPQ